MSLVEALRTMVMELRDENRRLKRERDCAIADYTATRLLYEQIPPVLRLLS